MINARKKNRFYLVLLALVMGCLTAPALAFEHFWLSGYFDNGSDGYEGYKATLAFPLMDKGGRVGDLGGSIFGYQDNFVSKGGYLANTWYNKGNLWLTYNFPGWSLLLNGDYVPTQDGFYSWTGTIGVAVSLFPAVMDGFYLNPALNLSRSYYSDTTVPAPAGSTGWTDGAIGINPTVILGLPKSFQFTLSYTQNAYDQSIPLNARGAVMNTWLGDQTTLGYTNWTGFIRVGYPVWLNTQSGANEWDLITPSIYYQLLTLVNATQYQLQSYGVKVNLDHTYGRGAGEFDIWLAYEVMQSTLSGGEVRNFFVIGALF